MSFVLSDKVKIDHKQLLIDYASAAVGICLVASDS